MLKILSFLIFFILGRYSFACRPNEVHIREQSINRYTKDDGTIVRSHLRSEHCREIVSHNYFQDTSDKKIRNLDVKFKKWQENERKIVEKIIKELPQWLNKYELTQILRSDIHQGNVKNPAASSPESKVIVIFDQFFKSKNQKDIIIHEFAHIALWDLNPDDLIKFFKANGWTYKMGESPKPPKQLLLPDSGDSPSEDFANFIEIFYSNPDKLKKFNPASYEMITTIINRKEK